MVFREQARSYRVQTPEAAAGQQLAVTDPLDIASIGGAGV
jgi:hypothetical protein